MKIAHIADIHVKDRRRDEYAAAFAELAAQLAAAAPQAIVVAGDVFDGMTRASATNWDDVARLLKSLAEIAPVLVLPGNHDLNVRVPGRPDLLTPLLLSAGGARELQPPRVTLWRHSGCYRHPALPNIQWIVGAPDEPLPAPAELRAALAAEPAASAVGLFHETISGCRFPNGQLAETERFSPAYLAALAAEAPQLAVMLGDVHLRQEVSTGGALNARAAYPGSLVCQDFGEPHVGHGWAEWQLGAPGPPQLAFHEVANPLAVYTAEVRAGEIVTRDAPARPRAYRVRATDTTAPQLTAALAELKRRHGTSPREVLGAPEAEQPEPAGGAPPEARALDELLAGVPPKAAAEARQRHARLAAGARGAAGRVELLDLEFSNWYCYGEANRFDFAAARAGRPGLLGLAAANQAGKSSLLDVLALALTGAPVRGKRAEAVRAGSETAQLSLRFSIDGRPGRVQLKRHLTRKAPELTLEFAGENLTEKNVTETTRALQKLLGSPAHIREVTLCRAGAGAFTQCEPAARRAQLSDLLNLSHYAEEHKAVTKVCTELRAEIRATVAALEAALPGVAAPAATIAARAETLCAHVAAEARRAPELWEQASGLAARCDQLAAARGEAETKKRQAEAVLAALPVSAAAVSTVAVSAAAASTITASDAAALHAKWAAAQAGAGPAPAGPHRAPAEIEPELIVARGQAAASAAARDQAGRQAVEAKGRAEQAGGNPDAAPDEPGSEVSAEEANQAARDAAGQLAAARVLESAAARLRAALTACPESARTLAQVQADLTALEQPEPPAAPAAPRAPRPAEPLPAVLTEADMPLAEAQQVAAAIGAASFARLESALRPDCSGCAAVRELARGDEDRAARARARLLGEEKAELIEAHRAHAAYEAHRRHAEWLSSQARRGALEAEEKQAQEAAARPRLSEELEQAERAAAAALIGWKKAAAVAEAATNAASLTAQRTACREAKRLHELSLGLLSKARAQAEAARRDQAAAAELERELEQSRAAASQAERQEKAQRLAAQLQAVAAWARQEAAAQEQARAAADAPELRQQLKVAALACTKARAAARHAEQAAGLAAATHRLAAEQAYRALVDPKKGMAPRLLARAEAAWAARTNQQLDRTEATFRVSLRDGELALSGYGDHLIAPSPELASGYQQFALELAGRAALLDVARVPLPSLLLIDEGFGCLDGENLPKVAAALKALAESPRAGGPPPLVLAVTHREDMRPFFAQEIILDAAAGRPSRLVWP